jgi:hypothetical protein
MKEIEGLVLTIFCDNVNSNNNERITQVKDFSPGTKVAHSFTRLVHSVLNYWLKALYRSFRVKRTDGAAPCFVNIVWGLSYSSMACQTFGYGGGPCHV